jgi:hypothetical protein
VADVAHDLTRAGGTRYEPDGRRWYANTGTFSVDLNLGPDFGPDPGPDLGLDIGWIQPRADADDRPYAVGDPATVHFGRRLRLPGTQPGEPFP